MFTKVLYFVKGIKSKKKNKKNNKYLSTYIIYCVLTE